MSTTTPSIARRARRASDAARAASVRTGWRVLAQILAAAVLLGTAGVLGWWRSMPLMLGVLGIYLAGHTLVFAQVAVRDRAAGRWPAEALPPGLVGVVRDSWRRGHPPTGQPGASRRG